MGELSRVRAVSQALVCVCLTRGALAVQVSVALALGVGRAGLAVCVCLTRGALAVQFRARPPPSPSPPGCVRCVLCANNNPIRGNVSLTIALTKEDKRPRS